jgi:hypothetical protein
MLNLNSNLLYRQMVDRKLAGARFVRISYGLVADLPVKHNYTDQFYVALEFQKGVETFNDCYSLATLTPRLCLRDLGEILKHKTQTEDQVFYTFTDNSIMPVGA